MDDHIIRIDQHPVTGILALDPGGTASGLLVAIGEFFGDAGDLPGVAPRGDHHVIGHGRAATQVDLNDILGLVIIKRGQDTGQNLIARQV